MRIENIDFDLNNFETNKLDPKKSDDNTVEQIAPEDSLEKDAENVDNESFMAKVFAKTKDIYENTKNYCGDKFEKIKSAKKEDWKNFFTKERENIVVEQGGKVVYDTVTSIAGIKAITDWSLYGLSKMGVKTSMRGDVHKYFTENNVERSLLGMTNKAIELKDKAKYKKDKTIDEHGNIEESEKYLEYRASKEDLINFSKKFKSNIEELNVGEEKKKELRKELALIMKEHKMEKAELYKGQSEEFNQLMRKYTGAKVNSLKLGKDAFNSALSLSGFYALRGLSYATFSGLERGKKEWDQYSREAFLAKQAESEGEENVDWKSNYREVSGDKFKEVLRNTVVGSTKETYNELVYGRKEGKLSQEEKEAKIKEREADEKMLEAEGKGFFGKQWHFLKKSAPEKMARFKALGAVARFAGITGVGISAYISEGENLSGTWDRFIDNIDENNLATAMMDNSFSSIDRMAKLFDYDTWKERMTSVKSGADKAWVAVKQEFRPGVAYASTGAVGGATLEQQYLSRLQKDNQPLYDAINADNNATLQEIAIAKSDIPNDIKLALVNQSENQTDLFEEVGNISKGATADQQAEIIKLIKQNNQAELKNLVDYINAEKVTIKGKTDTFSEAIYEAAKGADNGTKDNFIKNVLGDNTTINDENRSELISKAVKKLSAANIDTGDGDDVENLVHKGNVVLLKKDGTWDVVKGESKFEAKQVSELKLRQNWAKGFSKEHNLDSKNFKYAGDNKHLDVRELKGNITTDSGQKYEVRVDKDGYYADINGSEVGAGELETLKRELESSENYFYGKDPIKTAKSYNMWEEYLEDNNKIIFFDEGKDLKIDQVTVVDSRGNILYKDNYTKGENLNKGEIEGLKTKAQEFITERQKNLEKANLNIGQIREAGLHFYDSELLKKDRYIFLKEHVEEIGSKKGSIRRFFDLWLATDIDYNKNEFLEVFKEMPENIREMKDIDQAEAYMKIFVNNDLKEIKILLKTEIKPTAFYKMNHGSMIIAEDALGYGMDVLLTTKKIGIDGPGLNNFGTSGLGSGIKPDMDLTAENIERLVNKVKEYEELSTKFKSPPYTDR